MDTTSLKQLLDACFTAKHIVETLPQLPKGMKPRHIHVLDSVSRVCTEQGECRVSDVSTRLNITMPSITKLVQELEMERPEDFLQFVPPELEGPFTTKDFAKAARISQTLAQVTLNILYHMEAVARVGKKGNLYLYEAGDF